MDARRRLAVISAHICSTGSGFHQPRLQPVSVSGSSSGSDADQGKSLNGACVFCRIIRGESPAFKVIAAMCSKVPLISSAIVKATGSDSFNLLVNNGAAAGQVIFHTHIHIIPRKEQDCLWASESLRRQSLKLDQEASRLADLVREQLSSVSPSSSSSGNSEVSEGEGSSLSRS